MCVGHMNVTLPIMRSWNPFVMWRLDMTPTPGKCILFILIFTHDTLFQDIKKINLEHF